MNSAKIIAITQPLMELSSEDEAGSKYNKRYMRPEEFLAYTARVSNPSNQMNNETSDKLLRYCIREKHWSVFEQVSITMEIETTRDIARQILRHRSFSFQEFSQRYADPINNLGFELREARLQDNKNRQNSIETNDPELHKSWNAKQQQIIHEANLAYNWAIENGIAKEQARSVLPEGNTKSRLYMSGTLRSWIHFVDVRASEGTQKEHRQIALAVQDDLRRHFTFLEEYWFPKTELVRQEDLGKEFSDILYKNLWDLYEEEKKPWWKFW